MTKTAGFTLPETILMVGVLILVGFVIGILAHQQNLPKHFDRQVAKSSFQSGAVTITYINMPGLADFKAHNIHAVDEQNGNFIFGYQNLKNSCQECANPNFGQGKVVYDSQTVFSGNLDSLSPELSANGQHFIYAVPDTAAGNSNNKEKYYLDNSYVPNSSLVDPFFVGIANSGSNYMFTANNGTSIYTNNTQIYSNNAPNESIDQPVTDSNAEHYLTGIITNPDNRQVSIVYDGRTLNSTADTASLDNALSNNGQHYIYTTNTTVIVDGKTVLTLDQTPPLAQEIGNTYVTNEGHYAFNECTQAGQSFVYFDAQRIANGTCTIQNMPLIAISIDGSHYFYGNLSNHVYYLDGKAISVSGTINKAQFVANTLYVYRWVQ